MSRANLEHLGEINRLPFAGALSGRAWWVGVGGVLLIALLVLIPTTGDMGLTWDEPAYRFSQLRSEQWWSRLGQVRSSNDLSALLDPNALLFYWTYARHGINFHPPLAGQLSVLTHTVFGGWMLDIPARRMASVLEFAAVVVLAFGFLAGRYSLWVGLTAAGSLLLLPRVYGDAHLATTDMPGMLLWVGATLACWKGLYEPNARRWRILVGVLVGLAFVEKMGAVFVVGPLCGWLILARLGPTLRYGTRSDWVDGILTSTAMLLPLVVAFAEILRLTRVLPVPMMTNMFLEHPYTPIPGGILAVPLLVWLFRRFLGWLRPRSAVWGVERPALEVWTSILAFGSVVAWLGNPTWWRETMPRLAHYYMINTDRRGSLPDIQILYFGQTYEYSLPWHNAWVLIGITVPTLTLLVSMAGLFYTFGFARRDHLPLYFLLHLLALPVTRMLPTPAHDGVRLFLPTFFFLTAMAGWGAAWLASGIARLARLSLERAWIPQALTTAVIVAASGWQLFRIHPYELSYYNELIGGPRGAWNAGFELTYWYDAFNGPYLEQINRRLPRGATVDFLNDKTNPSTFLELQSLGQLRPDLRMGERDQGGFPHVWLLTQDSKASAFTRLLFAMKPWCPSTPSQLDGLQVANVADPVATSRAWTLWLLCEAADDSPPEKPIAPAWVEQYAPFLQRFWGVGLKKVRRLAFNQSILDWAKQDPEALRRAARRLAEHAGDPGNDADARRLRAVLNRYQRQRPGDFAELMLKARPRALTEAVEILIQRGDQVRQVMQHYAYTDAARIGGYLDQGLEDASATPTPTATAGPASSAKAGS